MNRPLPAMVEHESGPDPLAQIAATNEQPVTADRNTADLTLGTASEASK